MGIDIIADLGFYSSGLKNGKHLHLNSGKGDLLGDIYLNDGSPNSNVYITGDFIGATNLYVKSDLYTKTEILNGYYAKTDSISLFANIPRVEILEDKLQNVSHRFDASGNGIFDINVYISGNIINFDNIVGISKSVFSNIPTRIDGLESKTQYVTQTTDLCGNNFFNIGENIDITGNVNVTGDVSCNLFLGIPRAFFANIPSSYRNRDFNFRYFIEDIYKYCDDLNGYTERNYELATDAYDLATSETSIASGAVAGVAGCVVSITATNTALAATNVTVGVIGGAVRTLQGRLGLFKGGWDSSRTDWDS